MSIAAFVPQAESVQQWTLIPSTAYTSSDATTYWGCDFFSSEEITVTVTTGSGSLAVYLQKLLPDNSTPDDIAAFAAFTGAGTKTLSFVNGGNTLNTSSDAALTTNTVQTVHFGSQQRIKFVITGSNATFTFGVFGNFRS